MTAFETLKAERLTEDQMAELRGLSLPGLRNARYRAVKYDDHPPWIKDGRLIVYPVDAYRKWLKTKEQRPQKAS